MKTDGKPAAFFESLIMTAIVLVMLQTFLEDFAVVAGWSWPLRRGLVVSGFLFDCIFSIEFMVRAYWALVEGRFGRYLRHERGWIDLVASLPLVLFSSGPAVLALAFGGVGIAGYGGALNLLKVVKAIRIARVLRLLRALKLFRRIKFAESPMAQRHVVKITGLAVSGLVFAAMAFSLVAAVSGTAGLETEYLERNRRGAAQLAVLAAAERPDASIQAYADLDTRLLVVRKDGRSLYSRHPDAWYADAFGPADYQHFALSGLDVFFDLRPVHVQAGLESLANYAVILVLLMIYLFHYSGHFALTVSDPLNVMIKGMREKDYNLEALVEPLYAQDEVFILAGEYNRVYLPLKDLSSRSRDADPALKLSDVQDLFKTGG
jgi:hypothetical protein